MQMTTFEYLRRIIADELLALKEILIEQYLFALLLLLAIVCAVFYLKPFPPNSATMAIGGPGTPSYVMSEELSKVFKKNSLNLKTKNSVGSVQSIELLEDTESGVDLALIVGGSADENQAQKFYSLGSMGYSPIWIFYRKDLKRIPRDLQDLSRLQLKVGIGPKGGATVPLTRNLFHLNGIDITKNNNFRIGPYDDDVKDLLSGKIDCAIIATTFYDWDIQKLLRESSVELLDVDNTKAYQMAVPYLESVILPKGSVDIERNIPPKDISLIAPTINLVVRKDLNPDIQTLLLSTAKEFLYTTSYLFFAKRGEFPAYVDTSIPLSPVALEFYSHGLPIGYGYLPFWIAGFVNRFWVFVLTFLAVLYPIVRLNLHLRSIRFHIKQHRFFDALHSIERQLNQEHLSSGDKLALLSELKVIKYQACIIRIPTGMEESHFNFLNTIYLMELKIKEV